MACHVISSLALEPHTRHPRDGPGLLSSQTRYVGMVSAPGSARPPLRFPTYRFGDSRGRPDLRQGILGVRPDDSSADGDDIPLLHATPTGLGAGARITRWRGAETLSLNHVGEIDHQLPVRLREDVGRRARLPQVVEDDVKIAARIFGLKVESMRSPLLLPLLRRGLARPCTTGMVGASAPERCRT